MSLVDAPRTPAGVAALYFRHRATRVIVVSGLAVVLARVFIGGVALADLAVVLAFVVAWPAVEWTVHVIMHRPPIRIGGRVLDPTLMREHRLHHEQPGLVDHILFRPGVLVVLALVATPSFVLLLGPPRGLTAAACFHVGGMLNGWVHLLTHTRYRPRSRLFRWIRRTHYLHHLRDSQRGYAFTGPWVDALFGTRHRALGSSPARKELG